MKDSWLVLGDFNEVIASFEVKGKEFLPFREKMFADCLNHCHLLDWGSIRSPFTWHRSTYGQQPVSKRLDKVVSNVDWHLKFPKAVV